MMSSTDSTDSTDIICKECNINSLTDQLEDQDNLTKLEDFICNICKKDSSILGIQSINLVNDLDENLPAPVLMATKYSAGYDISNYDKYIINFNLKEKDPSQLDSSFKSRQTKVINLNKDIPLHRLLIGTKLSLAFNTTSLERINYLRNKYFFRIVPKSKNFLPNFYIEEGIIDLDYEGEIFVKIIIPSFKNFEINSNTYLAQLILCERYTIEFGLIAHSISERKKQKTGESTEKALSKLSKRKLI